MSLIVLILLLRVVVAFVNGMAYQLCKEILIAEEIGEIGMKNKIVKITAALAVMMALTGIAAAAPSEQINVVTNGGTLPGDLIGTITVQIGGTNDNLDILVHTINGIAQNTEHDLSIQILDSSSNPTTGLEVTVAELTSPYGTDTTGTFPIDSNPIVKWRQDLAPPDAEERLDMKIKEVDGSPKSYTVRISDTITGITIDLAVATISVDSSIPEFSTIAIPIAAVLGLVFFFFQRKNKIE